MLSDGLFNKINALSASSSVTVPKPQECVKRDLLKMKSLSKPLLTKNST